MKLSKECYVLFLSGVFKQHQSFYSFITFDQGDHKIVIHDVITGV